jgi:hypothetical protein
MAGITRAQFQRLVFPGLREIIFKYREKEPQYTKIFNMLTTGNAFEEDYMMAGVLLFQRTDESTEVPSDEFKPGLSIRYDVVDYTLQIPFSLQFIRDVQYKIWNDRARDLGFSSSQTEEVLHADLYNNGFTNVGYDNVSFFSASHPLIRGGGTNGQLQSNVLASPSTLSVSSYRDMLTLSRLMFDETGVRRIQFKMRDLVVPPQLEYVGMEITKSAGRPDTANRVDNVTKGSTSCMVWDYLINSKYWFMGVDKGSHKVKSYMRTKFRTRTYMDDRTEDNIIAGRTAFTFGYSDYKGWWGTNPI